MSLTVSRYSSQKCRDEPTAHGFFSRSRLCLGTCSVSPFGELVKDRLSTLFVTTCWLPPLAPSPAGLLVRRSTIAPAGSVSAGSDCSSTCRLRPAPPPFPATEPAPSATRTRESDPVPRNTPVLAAACSTPWSCLYRAIRDPPSFDILPIAGDLGFARKLAGCPCKSDAQPGNP